MARGNFKHGYSGHPLYGVWISMIDRCINPKSAPFKDYGGRGIKVCQRWLGSVEAFISDMGPRPDGYSLDRINNDGNYSPDNCRWATRSEQRANTRKARLITVEGKQYHIMELAKLAERPIGTIVKRVRKHNTLTGIISKTNYTPGFERGTHCRRGHELTTENTYIQSNGRRNCRTCTVISVRRRRPIVTHCKRDHAYTPENMGQDNRQRYCRECNRLTKARYRAKKRAMKHATL